MIVMPKKNRARRHPKKDKGIYITDEAWEAARNSITAQNKKLIMRPPGEKFPPPRAWEYPVVWNLPKDTNVETQPSTTESPNP